MTDAFDKHREDFLSEAQEIVEAYSRNVLAFDAALRTGGGEPGLINEAFRAVHTLKGLAGLFGADSLNALSHRVEDVLDDLRLGRLEPSSPVLDVLFRAVDVFLEVLKAERDGSDAVPRGADQLLNQIKGLRGSVPAEPVAFDAFEFDSGTLGVLTEYEEHRLRTAVEAGFGLYRLRAQFDVMTIDTALDELKLKATRHGEIITYLPAGESTSLDVIELDVLLASNAGLSTLIGALASDTLVVEEIPRKIPAARSHGSLRPPSLVPVRGPERADAVVVEADLVAASLRSVAHSVRVDIRKLDHLMNIVGQLGMARTSLRQLSDRLRGSGQKQLHRELSRIYKPLERRLEELQAAILEVRMVPLGQVFERLEHIVRRMAREGGKEIRLVITGAETEIDKLIVEELSDPLLHMIHNACDHGIEPPEERKRLDKPAAGTIALNAFQQGNHVVIEIEDDGAGIDAERLVVRAVSAGYLASEDVEGLEHRARLGLMFLPGLSTRSSAGDTSGRGVGMDIVKTNISRLGGLIDLSSELGIGTKVTLTLPVTLAIVSALIVRVAGQTFAIPLNSITEAIPFDEAGTRILEQHEIMTLRQETLPLCRLERLFELEQPHETLARRFVVVASLRNRKLGFVVDHLAGQQDIVIKALGPSLRGVRGFAGVAELGDQEIALVLDVPDLVEEVLAGGGVTRGSVAEVGG